MHLDLFLRKVIFIARQNTSQNAFAAHLPEYSEIFSKYVILHERMLFKFDYFQGYSLNIYPIVFYSIIFITYIHYCIIRPTLRRSINIISTCSTAEFLLLIF